MYAYADYTSSDKRLLTKDAELIPIGEISSSINTNIYDDGNLRR